MPKVYGLDDEIKSDGKSCSEVREDLKDCVLTSDCVLKVSLENGFILFKM